MLKEIKFGSLVKIKDEYIKQAPHRAGVGLVTGVTFNQDTRCVDFKVSFQNEITEPFYQHEIEVLL